MENEFPPNSHESRESRSSRKAEKAKPERMEVVQITTGRAVLRKKPLRKKFLEAFRPEDNVGFVEHTLLEVLVPSIKDGLADAATNVIEGLLGTSGASRRRHRGSGGGGYTSYNRMSNSRSRRDRDRDDDDRRPPSRRAGYSADDREVILNTRGEAEEVLDTLIELISTYDAATKRDLFSMIGEQHNPVDEDWGWTDLRGARIHKIGRDGYLLDLPRAEYLD